MPRVEPDRARSRSARHVSETLQQGGLAHSTRAVHVQHGERRLRRTQRRGKKLQLGPPTHETTPTRTTEQLTKRPSTAHTFM